MTETSFSQSVAAALRKGNITITIPRHSLEGEEHSACEETRAIGTAEHGLLCLGCHQPRDWPPKSPATIPRQEESERKPGYGKCKGCGKKIIWARGLNGKWQPLDAVAPCFRLIGGLDILTTGEVTCERATDTLVSHFATCPDANRFSRKGKKPQVCAWTENPDEGYYDTGCGESFCFETGSRKRNRYRFCPSCGKSIEEANVDDSAKSE